MGFLLGDKRQLATDFGRLQVGDRDAVELLDLGLVADLLSRSMM